MFCPNKQQGIALIQVLLISAVLTVLAFFLTSTAKNQVKIAQWSDDKVQALVNIKSVESELLFTLLVNSKVKKTINYNNIQNNISNNWNFFAKPFVIKSKINQQVNVVIQDQSALVHAHFPDSKVLKALIASQGYSVSAVNSVFDNLLDWQDLDSIPRINGYESLNALANIRNGAVPDLRDFSFVKGITPKLLNILVNNTTIYAKGFFNPMYASKELLSAITNTKISQQVIDMRNKNQLTTRQFSQITGIVENNKTLFYPSNTLSIKLKGQVGKSTVKKTIIVELSPYANKYQQPINILSQRG